MNRAALYLRSSKDRKDVSIDIQRAVLQELATERGLVVVAEYVDVVESGKDEGRPGFQQLQYDLGRKPRPWDFIIVLDTSRLSRRRVISVIFEEKTCKRAGVRMIYKSLPENMASHDEMAMKGMFQVFDEYHSLVSRAKGLAGMQENVRKGWRAGGKAPRGYQLEQHSIGLVREGAVVFKTKLKQNGEAPIIAAYLRARAAGRPRAVIASELQLPWSSGSLNDLEWMALTYAGHTVWGATNELGEGGYANGTKRKPRAEWTIQRNTHESLITDAEADTILERLERGRTVRSSGSDRPYLLTGILLTPEGKPWGGEWDSKMDAGIYRVGKGKRISARRVDGTVLEQLHADLASDQAVENLLRAMRAMTAAPVDGKAIATAEKRVAQLTNKVATLVDMLTDAGEDERAAYRRSIAAHEAERKGLLGELERMRAAARQHKDAKAFTAADARRLLRVLFDGLRAAAESQDVETTKAALGGLVERVVLSEDADHLQIHYRIAAADRDTGVKLATLRDGEATPVRWISEARIVPKRNGTSG